MTTAERSHSREELAETVRLMLAHQGVTQTFVAEQLGISRSYVNDLLHDPDGAKVRARKDSYRQPCPGYDGVCGKLMDGGNGRQGPRLCAECTARKQHGERRWTRDACLAAGRLWLALTDEPPTSGDWTPAIVRARMGEVEAERRLVRLRELGESRFPDYGIVVREFGSWDEFRDALGFPVPPGGYERTAEWKERNRGRLISPEHRAKISAGKRRKSRYRYVELFTVVRALEATLGRPPAYQDYAVAVARPLDLATLYYRFGRKGWLKVIWLAAAGGEEAYL